MKKIMSLILILMMVLTMTACSTSKSSEASQPAEQAASTEPAASAEPAAGAPVEVNVFQFKVEIVDQLEALVADFEAEHPEIHIVMDTAGGGQDYIALLKTRMNSGNEPAIFNVAGPTERDLWLDYLEPLSDQPWIASAVKGTLDNVSVDGTVYGMPYAIEGYGIIYNKAILDKAGIDPSTIDSFSKLKAAFETLDAQKEALGIENVISYSVGDSAWWTAAYHTFNVPFAMQEDPMAFIAGLNDGSKTISGNDRFEGFLNLLDLFFKYSYEDLNVVSYDDQVANFALGKTALMHQGNWTIGMIQEVNPDLEMGFLPIALSDDASWHNDSIPVGVPNFWVVNKNAAPEVKAAAKVFLDYLVNTERGQQFLVDECQFIPAFTNVTREPKDSLSKSIQQYANAGKTIPWVWHAFPSGYNENDAKQAIQDYYNKVVDREGMLKFLDEKWQEKVK